MWSKVKSYPKIEATMNNLHKVLCDIAEADHADQYIDTLKGVRESMEKMRIMARINNIS